MKINLLGIAIGLMLCFAPSVKASPSAFFQQEQCDFQIDDETINLLLEEAAGIWVTSFEELSEDYENGLLKIVELGAPVYQLYHRSHGTVIIELEEGI